jgi:ribosomal protein S18 acetylase RimI-like enzyme/nitroimidazol reductase NimA-like FMN-containing flavoprotein (pyridoxamine 5'-phosphate oxidase superfamily)
MRRSEFAMTPAEARAFLAEQAAFHLASTTPDGAPLLRTLHGVIVDDYLAFHSAPKGEKTSILGRAAVAQAEETIATVPSTFFDPVKACPATTYYRSACVHGIVLELTEPALKARALQALMEKLQPGGGYRPITADDPMYRPQVNGLLVAGLRLEHVDGKAKLAQNRKPPELAELLTSLWQRGDAGDPRAIELLRAANPDTPTPPFLVAPDGVTLHAVAARRRRRRGGGAPRRQLLERRLSPAQLAAAQRGSTAWIGARDRDGAIIGSARAISDGVKRGWIYDVIVAPAWRGRGVGQALVRLMLDHPALRTTANVLLGTRDAQSLYAKFGFVDVATRPPRGFDTTEMVREQRPG